MKSISLCTALVIMAVSVMAGETVPADRVKAAVQKLADAPNYSWRITVSSGEKSRFTPGPIEGQTEKGGFTRWNMSFGERNTEAFVKDGRVVVKTEDGWTRPGDIKPPPPPKTSCDGEGRKEGHHKAHKVGFLAHRVRCMKVPAEMAAELSGKLGALQGSGDEISGDLSANAAKEMLAFGSHRRDGHHAPPEPVNPRGTVKFRLKDGLLQTLEIHLTATMTLNGNEFVIDRTTSVEIKDAGTTKMKVPVEAKQLLESEPLPPEAQKKPA